MGKKLVIVESPAKAKTINKILGKDYVVKASMGHVRDLPEKNLGIDIDKDFKPQYVNIKSREKVLKELQEQAGDSEAVFLAPDPDREGEAIAWHLREALKKKVAADHFFRVTYNEITEPAIRKAFSQPGQIDQKRVDSQQARRVLDRLVGYKVSPLLWRRIRGASSAGRVQSVALRLVCEREQAILNFKPEEFWLLGAKVRKQVAPLDPFEIRLAKINNEKAEIKTSEQAEKIRADLDGRELKVSAIIQREISKKAMPPYITSTLQQAASSWFGFAPAHTMRLAQKLYEGVDFGQGHVGLITYMRTDSVAISQEAQATCREFVLKSYGPEFVPEKPNFYKSRSSAQEAHEAIRPTDVNRLPENLSSVLEPDELKLYKLIWQRFVASQMTPARIAQRTAEVIAVPPAGKTDTYLFRASASEVVFPGYMKVTGIEEKKKDENGEEIDRLPPLTEGEGLDCLEWLSQQKFTQPPARYTEASLVKALEENGVGRPSTYAQILSTLINRQYVEKEKRSLKPTVLGMSVNDFLVSNLNELFDVKFTAGMEEALDEIEKGSVEWTGMMKDFYGKFLGWMAQAKGPDANPDMVRRLLDLTSTVQEWGPETKRGKRTYSDRTFCESLRKQLDEAAKPISERQVDALKQILARYKSQIPSLDENLISELGLKDAVIRQAEAAEPPSPETIRKLELLQAVKFNEPRTVGKKVYDDAVFFASLRDQVARNKRLSPNQVMYLDRLVMKYSDQIQNFDQLAGELGLANNEQQDDQTSGPLLELMKQIKEWKPAVQRGKREWDDKKFYESLSRQFAQRKQLSVKQVASLKKLISRYAAQIANYEEAATQYSLPPPKKAAASKLDESV
jgi:DNA topoisomerase-1